MRVVALLGADSPRVTDGYGGWTVVDRPRRTGVTLWNGRNPFTLELHLVLDGFLTGESVEADVTKLERMAMPPADGQEPPQIDVDGAAVPHDDLSWVISGIDWGSDIERDGSGHRLRQDVTLTLLRYAREDRLRVQKASKKTADKSRAKGKPQHRTYTTKAGDTTLQKVAARKEVYGDASKWHKLADLNNMRGSEKLKINTKLIIA